MSQNEGTPHKQPDLNKSLPPSPVASTSSLTSRSSGSCYSDVTDSKPSRIENAKIGMDCDIAVTSNAQEAVSIERFPHQSLTPISDTSVLSSQDRISQTDAVGEKQRPPSSSSTFGSRTTTSLPTTSPSKRVANDNYNGFESVSYDDVTERPIYFHPQSRLIDIPRPGLSKKISLSRLFKSSSLKKQVNDFLSLRSATSTQLISNKIGPLCPPRPPRPPRHLCPSPPQYQVNIHDSIPPEPVNQRYDTSVNNAIITEQNTSKDGDGNCGAVELKIPHALKHLHHNAHSFVNLLDLSQDLRHPINDTHHGKPVAQVSSSSSPQSPISVSMLNRSSESLQMQPFYKMEIDSAMRGPPATANFNRCFTENVSVLPRMKSRRHTFEELDHVPEDVLLQSFSPPSPPDTVVKNKNSFAVRSCSMPSSSLTYGRLSINSEKGVIGYAINDEEVEDESYKRGREHVKAVSHRLRQQYLQKWDQLHGYSLANSEDVTGSSPFAASQREVQHDGIGRSSECSLNIKGYPVEMDHRSESKIHTTFPEQQTTKDPPFGLHHDGDEQLLLSDSSPNSAEVEEIYSDDDFDLVPKPLRTSNSSRSCRRGPTRRNLSHDSAYHSQRSSSRKSLNRFSTSLDRQGEYAFRKSVIDHSDNTSLSSRSFSDEAHSRPISPLLPVPPSQPLLQTTVFREPAPTDTTTQTTSSVWNIRRLRSELRLSKVALVEQQPVVSLTERKNSTSSMTYDTSNAEYKSDDKDSIYAMYAGNEITPVYPCRPESPPPVPLRSPRRILTYSKTRPPSQETIIADLNGELSGRSPTYPSEYFVQSSGVEHPHTERHLACDIQYSPPQISADGSPERTMLLRGKSINYHVNRRGEISF